MYPYQMVDEHGNMIYGGVKTGKTPFSHPYNYDPFVVWEQEGEADSSVYTDRLLQQEYKKHNRLCLKHFGDEGQVWSDREPKKIEAFLREWMDNDTVVLIKVMQHCNQATGFPLWSLHFSCTW